MRGVGDDHQDVSLTSLATVDDISAKNGMRLKSFILICDAVDGNGFATCDIGRDSYTYLC